MILALQDRWALMALLAVAAWALSCVIDVCFVSSGVYRRASDGPAIAGLFCFMPALLASASLDLSGVDAYVIVIGALSGIVFLLHVYFYFQALFTLNDAVNAEIFNTLGVLLVPVLAFFILDERLDGMNYLAIGVAACGVVFLICLQRSRLTSLSSLYLAASVTTAALLMVLQAWVLEYTNYATAVWLFSVSAFVAVALLFGVPRARRRRLGSMCHRFGAFFVVVQLLELGAVLGSQRATDLGPSVSLVALFECSLPIFIMAFSWLIIAVTRTWEVSGSKRLLSTLADQTTAAVPKMVSLVLIVAAILLVQV